MRAILIGLCLGLAGCTVAQAEWRTGQFVDRMTDRKETFAALVATGTSVELYVGCKNGKVFPEIVFPQRIGVYEIGATYRFDSGKVVPRFMSLSTDGRSVWPWILDSEDYARRIRKSKRLRVEIGKTFLDFDLTGADVAIGPIRCAASP
jgi:hypothetical protein